MVSIKEQVKQYWDNEPCGTRGIEYPEGSREYYEKIMGNRYRVEPYLWDYLEPQRWHGKKLLEVGCGIGSDLMMFAWDGAEITGIDISSKSVGLANQRLSAYGLNGNVIEADAENLPFNDEEFDVVYSTGVLHHTPSIVSAISEIYRVLKPKGEIRAMLYHKYSLVALQMYLMFGLFKGRLFRSIKDIMANHHESVGTKVYSVSEVRKMLSQFRDLDIKTYVASYDVRYARDRYIFWLKRFIPHQFGWYILVRGRK